MPHDRGVIRQLNGLFGGGTHAGLTDGQLLERFVTRQGEVAEDAFATLVERHGAKVLRVCRSVLRDPHDAEDAFQATFLVLVKHARSVRKRESIGPWLHGVALRVASVARTTRERRCRHEGRAAEQLGVFHAEVAARTEPDLRHQLHLEIGRLPERYRAVVLACDLDGQSCERASQALGWPVGTVKSRLHRARALLRSRLARLGLSPALGLMTVGSEPARAAAMAVLVPRGLVVRTARVAMRLQVDGARALTQIVNSSVPTIMEGVMRSMILAKLKAVVGVALAGSVLAVMGVFGSGVIDATTARLQAGPNGQGAVVEARGTRPQAEIQRADPPDFGQGAAAPLTFPHIEEIESTLPLARLHEGNAGSNPPEQPDGWTKAPWLPVRIKLGRNAELIAIGDQTAYTIEVTNLASETLDGLYARIELGQGLTHPSEGRVLELDFSEIPGSPILELQPNQSVRLPALSVKVTGEGEATCTVTIRSRGPGSGSSAPAIGVVGIRPKSGAVGSESGPTTPGDVPSLQRDLGTSR